MVLRTFAVLITTTLGLVLLPSTSHAAERCAVSDGLAAYISKSLSQHTLSQRQAAAARCRPALILDVASVTGVTTVETHPATGSRTTAAHLLAPVACTDRARIVYSKNAFGMVLMWHKTIVEWCWDARMIITGGRSYSQQDTPGFCWSFDGPTSTTYLGGKGFGYWDVTRGSRFSCAAGDLGFHRSLYANLRVRGGGGAS